MVVTLIPELWRYQVRPADTETTFDIPVFCSNQPCVFWTLSIMHWLHAYVVNKSSVVLIALQPLWQLLALVHSFCPRLTLGSMTSWVQHQSRYLLQAPAKHTFEVSVLHQSPTAAMMLTCTSEYG